MARYWNSTPQNFVSQFVPENLELQQNYYDNLQKNQDSYQFQIDGLNKQSDALVNDIPGAIEAKKRIEGKVGELRNINYNDPQQQSKAIQGVKEMQYQLSPFGELGARDKKKKEYDAFQKDISTRYKDNPMMLSYMDKKLKEGNLTPERAITFDDKGNPQNTEIIPPKEFTYKDLNNELSSLLKDTEFDQISVNSGLTSEQGHQALYSYMSGNTQEKTGQKIYNSLKNRVLADGNLVQSIKADAYYFQGDEKFADQILETALQGVVIGGKFKRTNIDKKLHEDGVESRRIGKADDKKIEEEKQAWETTFSQMGDQGIANLSEVAKAEPTNSLLSKVFNFINPNNQAKGLINIAKLISPSIGLIPQIQQIENELSKDSKLSEDQLNQKIEIVTDNIKQQIGRDQKHFRETFGFNNPVFDQSYNLVNMFGKGNDSKSNPDYDRAQAVVASKDPNFNTLTKQQKFDKVKEEMDKFVESSKTNVVLVPMDKKELDFKNSQITNLNGTPTEKTAQLTNMGLTANGKFVDFYTGKETTLENITGETGQLKFMGQLENDNQFGPGMNYFQGANGKFYVSAGSLNNQKDNYINWNLKQTDNKFSQENEFPLLFENRRSINSDGTIPDGIPKGKLSKNLKTGITSLELNIGTDKITVDNNKLPDDVIKELTPEIASKLSSEDILKINTAYILHKQGMSNEQIKQLGF